MIMFGLLAKIMNLLHNYLMNSCGKASRRFAVNCGGEENEGARAFLCRQSVRNSGSNDYPFRADLHLIAHCGSDWHSHWLAGDALRKNFRSGIGYCWGHPNYSQHCAVGFYAAAAGYRSYTSYYSALLVCIAAYCQKYLFRYQSSGWIGNG